jgi:hypothetical protein
MSFNGLGAFGVTQSPATLLAQAQKKLLKLQEKPNQTVAVQAQEAGLQAQINVLQSGGTVDDAKRALATATTQAKIADTPPLIPPLPQLATDSMTAPASSGAGGGVGIDYPTIVYGGALLIGGLVVLAFIPSIIGAFKSKPVETKK